MKRKIKIIILISILLLFLLCFYLYYENNYLQVSNYTIKSARLPADFNNYKIVHISDFHNTTSKKLTADLIQEIKNCKPNLIALTGDLIDAKKIDIETAISFIKEINTLAQIYYVTGNHEASINNYDELKEKLENNNVIVLDDKVEKIKVNDSEINIVGINDPQMAHNGYFEDSVIVKEELIQIQYDKNNFSILLSHRPELVKTYAENSFDLVLSGHAHGGQIRIPFIGGLVAPNQGLFPKYTSGIYEEDKTKMLVSRGIGNSILPFRINNRPELVVIELKNK